MWNPAVNTSAESAPSWYPSSGTSGAKSLGRTGKVLPRPPRPSPRQWSTLHGLWSSARLLGSKELLNCENQPEHRKIYRKKLSFRYFMGNKRGAVLRFPPDLPPFLQDTAPCSLSGPNSIMILHSHISYLSNIYIYVILIYFYLTTCPLFHQTLTLRNT